MNPAQRPVRTKLQDDDSPPQRYRLCSRQGKTAKRDARARYGNGWYVAALDRESRWKTHDDSRPSEQRRQLRVVRRVLIAEARMRQGRVWRRDGNRFAADPHCAWDEALGRAAHREEHGCFVERQQPGLVTARWRTALCTSGAKRNRA